MSLLEVTGGKVWESIDNPPNPAIQAAYEARQSFKTKIGLTLLIVAAAIIIILYYLGFKAYDNYVPAATFDLNQGTQDKIRYIFWYLSLGIAIFGAYLIKNTIFNRIEMIAILIVALTGLFFMPILTASLNAYESVEVWVEEEYGLNFTNEVTAKSFDGSPVFMENEKGETIKVTFKTENSIITLVEQGAAK